jgi:acyl-CoA synthetase (AMP-forming)/AMP-acid ligase II/acyl carrier protein
MNNTLIDVLQNQADTLGDQIAYRFLVQGDINGVVETISYYSLLQRAKAIAVMLGTKGIAGKQMLLPYPSGLDFIEAFWGVIFAGGIPVPLQLAKAGEQSTFIARIKRIADDAKADFVLSNASQLQYATQLPQLRWLTNSGVSPAMADCWQAPNICAENLAFLQYTSGSTRQPRGVMISHANLLANLKAIELAGFGKGRHTIRVNWMPHYHDMGLVGGYLSPIFSGFTTVLMSPQSFLRDPSRWLKAISHFQAYSSGAPSFAYALAIQRQIRRELEPLDLSCWQVAFCGAEPIRFSVLEQFADTFAPSGFQKSAFLPCYGMAEATLFVTGTQDLPTLAVNRSALTQQQVLVDDSPDAQILVSSGYPSDSTQVRVVDSKGFKELPEAKIGEIWIKGDGISNGYFSHDSQVNPFNHSLNGESGFLRTGDLGFTYQNELYICGRLKDLIIIRGQNCYPQDIEYTVEAVDEAINAGSVAAFAISIENQETFVVVVGIRAKKLEKQNAQHLAVRIKSAIVEKHELNPFDVILVRSGYIPKTSSGKIQRSLCRSLWEQGKFSIILANTRQTSNFHQSIYPKLENTLIKLDKRNTRYQYDLDRDIEWHRIHEPGRYFPDSFLRDTRVNLEVLKTVPEAFAYYEQALALLICTRFYQLETAVLIWGKEVEQGGFNSRSLELLVTEETKHIDMFRRYFEVLATDNTEYLIKHNSDFEKVLHWALNPDNFQTKTEYHYTFWLAILFFEEYTLWLDELLNELGSTVQRTWKQVHHFHRREESQHVLTDLAYINALVTTHDERYQWSMNLLTPFIKTLTPECFEIIKATEEHFFQGQDLLLMPVSDTSLDFMGHPLFAKTRQVAPFIAFLARSNNTVTELSNHSQEDKEQLTSWLCTTIADIIGKTVLSIDHHASFSDLGLDSLGHYLLVAKLETHLGFSLPEHILFNYTSVDILVKYLITDINTAIRKSSSTEIKPSNPQFSTSAILANAGQQRFFNYDLEKLPPFHLYVLVNFDQGVDYSILQQAVYKVVESHESLRCCFRFSEQGVMLNIVEAKNLPIHIEEVLLEGNDFMAEISAQIERWNQQCFDMYKAPLWRLGLLQNQQSKAFALVWLIHHITSDGWSAAIIQNELLENYQALVANRQIERATVMQLSDICLEEYALIHSEESKRHLQWWQDQLTTKLAIKNPDPEASLGRQMTIRFLPLEFKQALQQTAKNLQCSLATLFLTVYSCVQGDYEGEGYVILCFHNRCTEKIRNATGYVCDSLLVPKQLGVNMTEFATALSHTQTAFNAALAHFLPIHFLTGELMGKDFIRQKRRLGASLDFMTFTENLDWQTLKPQLSTSLSHVEPCDRMVLFVWLLSDGIGLGLNFNAEEDEAWGEDWLDDFTQRLSSLTHSVI